MNGWLFLLLIVYFLPVALPNDFRREKVKELRRAWDISVVCFGVLLLFILLSYAAGLLHHALIGDPSKDEDQDKWKIDLWILGWFLIEITILAVVIKWNPWYIVFLLMRLSDLLYVLLRLVIFGTKVWTRGRALVFLLIHYWEVVITFACVYLFLQYLSGLVFCVQGSPRLLGGLDTFYFSFVTASTIGYGDITPCIRGNSAGTATALIACEVFCVILIVGFDAAHILGTKERKPRRVQNTGTA